MYLPTPLSRLAESCGQNRNSHNSFHGPVGWQAAASAPARSCAPQGPGLVLGLVLILLTIAIMVTAAPASAAQTNLLPRPSSDIACEQTPFGRRLTLGDDAEMLELLAYDNDLDASLLREWTLADDTGPGTPPLEAAISEFWRYYNGAGGTLLKAIHADLDGDGRDEIVIAMRANDGAGDHLRLGVFRRQPYEGTNIDLFSTWNLNIPFTDFDMVAGDFDGSQDGQQELALMIGTPTPKSMDVFVLTGNAEGGIAEADNTWSGLWTWHPASGALGATKMAAGNLLLDGREQMVVVAESDQQGQGGANRRLNYHLLEFQSQTQALPVAPGSLNIAGKSFDMVVGSSFNNSQGGWDIDDIKKLKVTTGDVAGDATDEMVVDIGFKTSGSSFDVIQYLHHFKVTRNDAREIIDIQFATRPNGDRYDSSQLVSQDQYLPGDWDVLVRNIDDKPKEEIVIVRNESADGNLQIDVYKASVELTASFTYYRTGNTVQFHDNSVGFDVPFDSGSPRWDFGDGSTPTDKSNPSHVFPGPGTYTVTLRLRQTVQTPDGPVSYSDDYALPIVVDDNTVHGGGEDPGTYMFKVLSNPYYAAHYHSENLLHFGPIRVAAGDMNRDGRVEIMTVARMGSGSGSGNGLLRSLWQLDYDASPTPELAGRHMLEQAGPSAPIDQLSSLALIPADFDGDSVEATITADCRAVIESKIHQLVWAPPYFQRFQASANRSASFGKSVTNGESTQSNFGSFTSTSISGYVGVELGVDLFGLVGASASARVTAGRYHQAAEGSLAGQDNSFALTEGYTQASADGLLSVETNTFYCYQYDVSQASVGLDPDSSLRICEIHDPETQTSKHGTSPEYWNREFPQVWAGASEGHPPPNWVPVTRDWANLALFKPTRSNADSASGSTIDSGVLTDGRFTTHVESQTRYQPYAEVDLGSVRAIANIRVFAPDDKPTVDLTGFRIYISANPMPDTGLPSGPDVHVFMADSFDGTIRGRWNIWTRVWNPDDSTTQLGDPLLARYIRLQHPGQARLNVSELQVFGDAHRDPPRYPDAVCDPHNHDGLFLAKVWDASVKQFRPIEVHGDILWLGTGPNSGPSWGSDGPYLQGCENDAALQVKDRNFNILKGKLIGSPSDVNWSFTSTTGATAGTTKSFESSTSVGAEFETSLTAGASFVAGGSKEFASGVTRDNQSSTYWSDGLDMGGSIGGFQPPYSSSRYVNACHYNARPYAYKLVDQSNTGYEHTMYVVDYVVPEAIGATAWTRAQLPSECRPALDAGDRIFQSGFELP